MSEGDQADLAAIRAAIDEMYAMISGPAGPRDWSRQSNCFHPDARQIRTWIDDEGRPAMKMMGLADYARDTTPFSPPTPFTKSRPADASTCSATWPMRGASMRRGVRPTTPKSSAEE